MRHSQSRDRRGCASNDVWRSLEGVGRRGEKWPIRIYAYHACSSAARSDRANMSVRVIGVRVAGGVGGGSGWLDGA